MTRKTDDVFCRQTSPARRFLPALILMMIALCTTAPAFAADWAPVEDLIYGDSDRDAVRLADGRVLFGAQVYDPATGQWSSTSMALPGYLSSATLLADGRVLVTGHLDVWFSGPLPYAQFFDPATDSWSVTTSSNFGHGGHLAVRLADGRVLVAGSRDGGTAAEIFDPDTQTWSSVGAMNSGHGDGGFAELLPNGRVIAGGGQADYFGTAAGIEIFDPATGEWTQQSNPPGFWRYAASTPLMDGRILVAAGSQSFLYDAGADSWTAAAGLDVEHLGHFSLTRLADGRVLAAGGTDESTYTGNTAEVYDPQSNTWTRVSDMPESRERHGAALLANGHVLLAGGMHTEPVCCTIQSAVLFTPSDTPAPPPVEPPPPAPVPMVSHVADLEGNATVYSNSWIGRITISVSDDTGAPVNGATVTAQWATGAITQCTTSGLGACTISTGFISKRSKSVTLSVTGITHASLNYDPGANTDPDGDSDGTTITLNIP